MDNIRSYHKNYLILYDTDAKKALHLIKGGEYRAGRGGLMG